MVFGDGQLNYARHIRLRQTLVAMVTKICDFQHKIGYILACAGDTAQKLARPCCHANENLEMLSKNRP